MNGYKNFVFFNKDGNPLDFTFDSTDKLWSGSLFLPKISKNLIENETIYILEQLLDSTITPFIGSPHVDITLPNGNIKNEISKNSEFFLFTVDNPYNPNPFITTYKTLQNQFIKDIGDTFNIPFQKIKTLNGSTNAYRLDIGFKSSEEGEFEDYLIISDANGIIAKIYLYCESVVEDDRFINLLSDMGEMIGIEEEYIFRTSDIKEDLPDFILLDEKRKELLVELHNIKPYIATYRGIFAVLNFFDYYDVRVKELWYDTQNKRYSYEEIHLGEIKKLDDPKNLDFNALQKTSFFGLFYDIRKTNGKYEDDGLPMVVDNFAYSQEEIIIKLFGLKDYFLKRGVGGVSRVIDIVGESVNFNRFDLRKWHDKSELIDVDAYVEVKFVAEKELIFVEDLRPIIEDYTLCPYLPGDDLSNVQVGLISSCFVGWVDDFNMVSPEYLDEENIPVGGVLKLDNRSFGLTWANSNFSWNQTLNSNLTITWNNAASFNYYETEWIIHRHTDINDTRQFNARIRKPTLTNLDLVIFLPYDGSYDVTLVLYGYDGNTVKLTKKKYITVLMREVNWTSFYQIIEPSLQSWRKNYLTWNQAHGEWINKQYDSDPFKFSETDIQNDTYKIENFINANSATDFRVGVRPPLFQDLEEITWNDYSLHTWKSLNYPTEVRARVIIDKITAGGVFQINDTQFTIPLDYNIGDFGRLATELNSLTVSAYPDIFEFEWVERVIFPIRYLEGVSKNPGTAGDKWLGSSGGVQIKGGQFEGLTWNEANLIWSIIPISWNNMLSFSRTNASENAFGLDNMRLYTSTHEIPLMHSLFFSFDNSKIPGKTSAIWTISLNGVDIISFVNKTFVYKFDKVGLYAVKLEITDSNGNKKELTKNNYVKVYKTKRFEALKEINIID